MFLDRNISVTHSMSFNDLKHVCRHHRSACMLSSDTNPLLNQLVDEFRTCSDMPKGRSSLIDQGGIEGVELPSVSFQGSRKYVDDRSSVSDTCNESRSV
jgi:hypothetical protein